MTYTIHRVPPRSGLPDAGDTIWRTSETARIANVRPESSDHHPETTVSLLHDGSALFGRFIVRDRYVRCVHAEPQGPVCQDSCVEAFLRPCAGGPYMNFEFNCGGTVLTSVIRDWTRVGDGFADYTVPPPGACNAIDTASSLPARVDPELRAPTEWTLVFRIPFGFMQTWLGVDALPVPGVWAGNFYKCGDETSHPHWLSWSPVDELNFHLPRCFGDIHVA